MNKKHTNKSIYTKLVMPRQLVLALLIPNQKGRGIHDFTDSI